MKKLTAFLLKFVNPHKPLGVALFNAIARVAVTPSIEAVALRQNGNSVEVYLNKRAEDDASYPSMWHLPGTVIRPGESLEGALKRLAAGECKVELENFEIIGIFNNPFEPRGHFISPIALIIFKQNPPVGKWLKVEDLDNTVIDFHKNFIIPIALKYFKSVPKNPVKTAENL